MSLKEKLFDSKVSRRSFLKGMAAVGTTAALYGCGSGGDGAKSYIETDAMPTPPEITGSVVPGAAPHNCGGRCVTKVYVENGTIKRIVTDETPDENLIDSGGTVDKPQMRACVRCRSNRQRFYRSDRILKPLKQMRERGNVNGFVEIDWDTAASEIAQKLENIKTTYGPETLYNHYASGDGNEVANSAACSGRLLNLLGGQMTYRSDYSWPSLEHTSWFYFGQNHYFPPMKSRQDAFNADVVVVWSGNFAESIWGTNTGWYLEQLKEMGKEVIIVDSRYSQTVATHATRYISLHPGTDAAVISGMIYHLIVNTWNEDGEKIGDFLDPEFILKYTHGFFDDVAYDKYDGIPKGYHDDVDREDTYIVPNGASLSAFIMGDDERLVKAGLNGKTSIYPGEIGYNNYNPEDPNDPLKDAYVPIYGQEPKTPEWAEKISGVPADTIKELAEIFAKKKVTMWLGGGYQRQSEGEQGPLFCYTIASITKNFGEPGRHVGAHSDRQPVSFGLGFPAGDNAAMVKFFSDYPVYDFTKISSPGNIDYTAGQLPKYYPAITMFTFPVFLWPDVANNNGEGKSMWNDGQVKEFPPMKALLNFGGNCLVNQCGDYNKVSEIVSDRSKVELIVVADQFMTPTARFADYILPAATAFEKEGACSGWLAGDALIRMNKAVEPLGEAKSDYDIVTMIADKLGLKDKFTEGKTAEDWIRDVVEPRLQAYGAKNEDGSPMSYEDWKEKGLFHMDETYGTFDQLANFRNNPEKNPLLTPSGKLEIYCQAIVEDYEARGYDNIDRKGKTLENGGKLKIGPGESSDVARYVYPIPMYIPMLEGAHKHAETGEVIDPQGYYEKGYKFVLGGWHIMYRSHSTHNNNAYLNEVFKKNINGEKAFLDYQERDYTAGPWDDNVYEPIWINPNDARDLGISTGDRVIVESPRGSIYASAVVTQRIRPGMLGMGQGGWANGDNKLGKPDVGGAINVLTKLRPSRICQGMTLGQDTLVSIRKA